MKLWQKNLLLLGVAAVLIAVSLLIAKGSVFAGTDGKAQSVITEISGDYRPWASPILKPAGTEVESMLFALQAAVGAGIIGFGFGRLSAKYKPGDKK